jgi:hypothetical protein
MFSRISNSWALVKASWAVLRADKELIVFPIVSFIGTIVVTIAIAVPAALTGLFTGLTSGEQSSQITAVVFGFLFYLVQYTVIFYCNTALVGAALIRLKGGDPTLSDGFRIAGEHFASIVGYAIISSTVGMILRALSQRGGILGQIVASLVGLAWNVATYLVVPVLVVEGVGPIEAVKRSAHLLKKTWGEQFVGEASIGGVFFLLFFALCLIACPAIAFAASTESIATLVIVGAIFVVVMLALGLISSALSGIYTAAVYRYAAEGETGGYFDAEIVKNTFKPKTG